MLKYEATTKMTARELRSNATPHEKKLWYDFLSKYPVRFLRQKPIGRYIADFYCHKYKLVIELDGKQHSQADNAEYDAIRTDYLNSADIKVIRFTNEDIEKRFDYVCQTIKENAPP
jgi:very-short-patch-repair endonuclease